MRATLHGCFLVAHEGKLVVTFSHRRLREKPPSGGVSTLRILAAFPDDFLEPALRFVDALRWSALAAERCHVSSVGHLIYRAAVAVCSSVRGANASRREK